MDFLGGLWKHFLYPLLAINHLIVTRSVRLRTDLLDVFHYETVLRFDLQIERVKTTKTQ